MNFDIRVEMGKGRCRRRQDNDCCEGLKPRRRNMILPPDARANTSPLRYITYACASQLVG